MPRYIVDTESDGLLKTVTKIWVIGWYNLDTGKSGVITDYSKMRRFLQQEDLTLICHNIIRFDVPLFEMILGIPIEARVIDTLTLSWYLQPIRASHGLESYGEEFGVPKPVIEEGEWLGPLENETFEEFIAKMINRVVEDVKINLKVFEGQLWYLKELYDYDDVQIKRLIGYLMYKMQCALEQEQVKWKLDEIRCSNSLTRFEVELERRVILLTEIMPEHILYKKLNKPKIMYKKDESLSKRGENWLSLLADLGLDENHDEPLRLEKTRENGNPGSHQQLKEWLYSLGWVPTTFKYEKEDNGGVRKIPQISLPRGEGLCPSVKLLYQVEPRLEELDMFFVVKHRIGLLKGFLRDADEQGFLQAKISGLTNTLRFKHSVVVNLPKPTDTGDWRDGAHIRGCLIAPEGSVLCGSDMSSLEDRTKQHYMHYFDPEYVASMNVKGFDPHLDLAVFGYEMTNGELGVSREDAEWFKTWNNDAIHTQEEIERHTHIKHQRSDFKTVNYGAVYGAGAPTMSRTTGMPVRQCTILLEAYWKKNWSVKEIAKACRIKTLGKQRWLQNPVSKFWYSLRALKDRFSTLNQGTGVYAFDRWVKNSRDMGIKMCGQFHDEVITPTINSEEHRATTKRILEEAIEKVNKELKLNRALGIDVQFGLNYAEIH